MKIGIVGSLQFVDQMVDLRDQLRTMGHDAFVTNMAHSFLGKNKTEIESIKLEQKKNVDTIKEFWNTMQDADALLVANYSKNGIENYIGGATLMEIGFAHVLDQKIYLLNPIPEIKYYKTEIEAVRPVIINGNLDLIV